MPLAHFRSPFGKIHLTPNEQADLKSLAKAKIQETVSAYEHFLWQQNSKINAANWSVVREKDDVRVYQRRRAEHRLVAVGTLVGGLDDVLYGALAATTQATRLHAAYTKSHVTNSAVLARLQSPTAAKPFRCVAIKWLVTALPLHARALSKKRDLVVVEYTGTRVLSNGETIGFQLVHSVELPQTPPLASYTRGGVSVCWIWRQHSQDRVQVYAQAVVAAGDNSLLASTLIRSKCERLVSIGRSIHCAQMKKLLWLMRCKGSVLGNRSHYNNNHQDSIRLPGSHDTQQRGCEVCPLQSTRRTAKASCAVCSRFVCSTCRIKLELCTIAPDDRLVEQRAAFCVPCHAIAVRADATDVATDEATQREKQEATIGPLQDAQYMRRAKQNHKHQQEDKGEKEYDDADD